MTVTNFFSSIHPWSVPEDRLDPPEQPYREIQDENAIHQALEEVEELMSSLVFLDRHKTKDWLFKGWRGGEDKLFDAYRALRIIREDLVSLLEGDEG